MSQRGDMKRLLADVARTTGWTVDRTAGNHIRILGPNNARVIGSFSNDPWAFVNFKKDLQRAGWSKEDKLRASSDESTADAPGLKDNGAAKLHTNGSNGHAPVLSPFEAEGVLDNLVFGAALKQTRTTAGLSMKDVADLLGRSTTTLVRYEDEGKRPTREVYEKLCEIFPVLSRYFEPSDLFRRKQHQPREEPAPTYSRSEYAETLKAAAKEAFAPIHQPPPKVEVKEPAPTPDIASVFRMAPVLMEAARDQKTWSTLFVVLDQARENKITLDQLRIMMMQVPK